MVVKGERQGEAEVQIRRLGLTQTHTHIYKIDHHQGPARQCKELYSIFFHNLHIWGKNVKKAMAVCVTESSQGTPTTKLTL